MRKLGRIWTLMFAGTLLAWGSTLPADAQEQAPYRVRGTLDAVASDKLTVTTREGETLDLTLEDDTRIMVVRPASLDDIKQGNYVGLTSVDSGGKRVAISAHIFGDDLRGTAEGHVPWDLVKEPNTMTNATVAEIEEVGDQRELTVSYVQGQGKQRTEGSQTIYVPDDLAVVKMEKAQDRSALQPGKKAFLVVRDDAEGNRTAVAVIVGEEGATPPM
jgi:nitrogen regulatory protein PII